MSDKELIEQVNLKRYQVYRLNRKRSKNGRLKPSANRKPSQVTLTTLERKAVENYVPAFGQRGAGGAQLSALLGAGALVLHYAISGDNPDDAVSALTSIVSKDALTGVACNLESLSNLLLISSDGE